MQILQAASGKKGAAIKMKRVKKSAADVTFDLTNGFLMIVIFLLCLYPFYYVLIYSLSDPTEAQKGVYLLPRAFTLINYSRIFQLPGIANAAVISFARMVLGTIITVVCCSMFAYLVSKREMYLHKLLYRLLVITMYFNSGLIPWYLTMKMYHLNNSFLLYIIPSGISAFNVILIKTFVEQLPASLEESAKLDGAGYFTIFWRIIFPLSKPIVATIAVFSAVGQWNSWFDNYILVLDSHLQTLQLILYDYLNQASTLAQDPDLTHAMSNYHFTPQAISMTITMVVTFPILFIYPFMQRYFVKGIMIGAIKG